MKRTIRLLGLLTTAALLAGCGGDDTPTGPQPEPAVRVQAAALTGAPSMATVNDVLWNTITPVAIDISTLNAPKVVPGAAVSLPDSVYVQAGVFNDSLYLRIRWNDNSHDILHNHYYVSDTSLPVNFTYDITRKEDHLLVLFTGPSDTTWDVWHWRSLTTAYAFVAEGQRLVGDSLVPDTNDPVILPARENPRIGTSQQPTFVHKDGPLFTDTIMYWGDQANSTNFINDTLWQMGQIVPGWLIDTSVVNDPPDRRLSRWDIRSIFGYSAQDAQYTVVLCRPLSTGYSDDLDLLPLDSVQAKIGILDNLDRLSQAGGQRGFTKAFWFIF